MSRIHMLTNKAFRFVNNDTGATMIEYCLLAALISVAAIVAVTAVGTNVNSVFTYVAGKLVAP